MNSAITNPLAKAISILTISWIIALAFLPSAFADPATDKVIANMQDRQALVADSYTQLDVRVNSMDPNDPRKDQIKKKLVEAQKAKDAFIALVPMNNIVDLEPNASFIDKEQAASTAINNVNRFIMAPVQPGATKVGKEGTVPTGSLTGDFIPQVIKLLFRFTSLMILISFVVSGVLFVIAFDNEDFVTKAKQMLYYSIIGFAFVTLAYAIVKGITSVNYFGVI